MTAKITPAMSTWCRALADLADCRLVRRTFADAPLYKRYTTEGPLRLKKPTWSMVDKLVSAGLIEWAERRPYEHVATLTELGRGEASREQKPVIVAASGWPFPVSAHQEPGR